MDKKTTVMMFIAFWLTVFVCIAAFNMANDLQVRRRPQVRRIREILSDNPDSENID